MTIVNRTNPLDHLYGYQHRLSGQVFDHLYDQADNHIRHRLIDRLVVELEIAMRDRFNVQLYDRVVHALHCDIFLLDK